MAVGTTRGKRRLGRMVRKHLGPKDMTSAEYAQAVNALAAKVNVHRTTIKRLLEGTHLPSWHVVCTALVELSATTVEIDKAREAHAVADVDTKSIEHARDLPPAYLRLRMDEAEAAKEETLNSTMLPGMLQTKLYAEAVARRAAGLVQAGWQEAAGAERQSRQSHLYRDTDPLQLHAVIEEAALHRGLGGRDVMLGQFDRLIDAAKLPNITIQIVAYSLDGGYGRNSGQLTVLRYPEPDEPATAFTESLTGLQVVEDVDAVDVLSVVWGDAAAGALSETDSIAFIEETRDRVRKL